MLRWNASYISHISLAKINQTMKPNISRAEKCNPTTKWRQRNISQKSWSITQSYSNIISIIVCVCVWSYLLGTVFLCSQSFYCQLLPPFNSHLWFHKSIPIGFCAPYFYLIYSSVYLSLILTKKKKKLWLVS